VLVYIGQELFPFTNTGFLPLTYYYNPHYKNNIEAAELLPAVFALDYSVILDT
jgi:hypothetical protein